MMKPLMGISCFRMLCIMWLLLTWGTPVNAEECRLAESAGGHWSELEARSETLGYRICQLAVAAESGEILTTQALKEAYESWHQALIKSAREIDGVVGPASDEVAASSSFQDFINILYADVGRALSAVLGLAQSVNSVAFDQETELPYITGKDVGTQPGVSKYRLKIIPRADDDERVFELTNLSQPDIQNRCKAIYSGVARGDVCIRYLDQWVRSVSVYRAQMSHIAPARMSKLAMEYSADWERFYTEGRAQTFLDTAYTAKRYSRELGSPYFQTAPEVQYFLFRPSIVMEYVADAQDGNEVEEALAFEWYGFNYWRGCAWLFDVACGASIVSIFSDRAGVDDSSAGLMLHIANYYSIGVTRSFDDSRHTGVFVTIDLLKALESKPERVKQWKSELDDLEARYRLQ